MTSLHRAHWHITATTLLVIAIAALDASVARAQQACLPAPDEAVGSVTDFLNDTTEAAWRSAHGITATRATSLPQLTDVPDAAVCRRIDSMMVKPPAFHFRTGGYIIVTDAGPLTADPRTGLTRITHREHIFVFDSVGYFVYYPRLRVQLAFIPKSLRVLNATAAQVNLAWNIHHLSGLTYQVQRALGSGAFANVGVTLSTGVTTATDSGVHSGNSYRYRLLAKTASGDSGYTNEVSVTTQRPRGTQPLRPAP
jgi:hypothetical protein